LHRQTNDTIMKDFEYRYEHVEISSIENCSWELVERESYVSESVDLI